MFRTTSQGKLFGGYERLRGWVEEGSVYAWLGGLGPDLFPDEMFRHYYCPDNGRPCIPPSKMAIMTFLQIMEKCSDEEAVERSKYDDRWKCALDLEEGEVLCCPSSLRKFRCRLHLHEDAERTFLGRSLMLARAAGLLPKGAPLRSAIDTTHLTGKGAVKDTYNLVADGITNLCRVMAGVVGEKKEALARRLDLSRYFESSSLKGSVHLDWTSEEERRAFLNSLAADARRLLVEAARVEKEAGEKQKAVLRPAMDLLAKLLRQDLEPHPEGGVQIKQGVAPDRTGSVHDPEARFGHKSASRRFHGHKMGLAVEPESGLVTGVEVQPGNTPDDQHALDLVKATEANTGMEVGKTIGDAAFGSGATRQAFVDEGRELVAKVPSPPADRPYHKAHFDIDLEKGRVTCPAGHTTEDYDYVKSSQGTAVRRFHFPEEVCQACPFKEQCLSTKDARGARTVTLHPQERLLQEARAYQETPEFQEDKKARQRAEHQIHRMIQIGGRAARYVGIAKNRTRSILVATVLNVLILLKHLQATGQTLPATLDAETLARESALLPRPDLSAAPPAPASPEPLQGVPRDVQQALLSDGARGDPPPVAGSRSLRGDP